MSAENILPWEYFDALGFDGQPVDEDAAMSIIDSVGVEASTPLGHTPLSGAAIHGNLNTTHWLLNLGADVDYVVPGFAGMTPLLHACQNLRVHVAEVLLDHGANIEAIGEGNLTPLAITFTNVFTDPIPLARLLLSRGAVVTEWVREMGGNWDRTQFEKLLSEYEISDGPGEYE